jgi:hypothetical protein
VVPLVVVGIIVGLDGAVVVRGVVAVVVVVVTSTHAMMPTVTYNINKSKFQYCRLNYRIALRIYSIVTRFHQDTLFHS